MELNVALTVMPVRVPELPLCLIRHIILTVQIHRISAPVG